MIEIGPLGGVDQGRKLLPEGVGVVLRRGLFPAVLADGFVVLGSLVLHPENKSFLLFELKGTPVNSNDNSFEQFDFFAGIERPVEDHLITLFGFLQKKTHHRMEASNLD